MEKNISMQFKKNISGIALCILIGLLSIYISGYIPLGAVALAIVVGLIIGNMFRIPQTFNQGIQFSEQHVLSFAIALLGVNLNFTILKDLGYMSIIIIILTMICTIGFSLLYAKIFDFNKKVAVLLGIGNGICGSSAIAATKGIIDANDKEAGLSIAVVNLLGTVGMFIVPLIAMGLMNLSDIKSGLLIGNTLQSVGQVMASGFSVNEITGEASTIVKMVRILMLTPVVFMLIFICSKNKYMQMRKKKSSNKFPLFIIGFLLFSFVPTFGLLPEEFIQIISKTSHYALIVAMAGLGLKIEFKSILKSGMSILIAGTMIFCIQIGMSCGLILLLHN